MMLSFGFRVLMQSGLSVLLLSTAHAAVKSPFPLEPAVGSAVSTASGTMFAQATPEQNTPNASSVPNAASLSLQMSPDRTARIGTKVSFRVTTKKPGYLLLVDIDADGKMSQIFPSPELIAQSEEAAMNFIKPGEEMLLPNSVAKKHGFEYVTTPPAGAATVVAILSDRRVQILDLPDTSQKTRTEAETLNLLTEWTRQLRVPDLGTGKLQQSNWSFDIKRYLVQ
jgi:Domain of unknown function (DUF4384)